LIVLIIIVASLPVFALLGAIAIPNFIRAKLTANEASASAIVKSISTAIEGYYTVNTQYPLNEDELISSNYLAEKYDKTTKNGYVFSLNFTQDDYEVIATPQKCAVTGKKVFTARKYGELSEEDCKK